MSRTWSLAIAFLVLGALACAFGVWTYDLALQRKQEVLDLESASLQLDRYEQSGTLADRAQEVSAQRARLEARLAAATRGAGSLDTRLAELFGELDLEVRSSTAWEWSQDTSTRDSVVFLRTIGVSGSFASLRDAIASLESWPDLIRVRGLTVEPEAPGRVAVTLRLAVRRLPPDAAVDADGKG